MKKIICLDAGHFGKYNQSPVNKNYFESDFSWKFHLLLKAELEARGFDVVTTRADKDKDLALEKRGKCSTDCLLFLSIHSNATSDVSANYALACCLVEDNSTNIDEISVQLGKKLADSVTELMTGKINGGSVWRRKGDSGDYYGVLRGAKSVGTPAILLEHGFHTNLGNTNWLLDDNNLKIMAEKEAEIIADFFHVEKPKEQLIGDIDGDGQITSYDALKILQEVVE